MKGKTKSFKSRVIAVLQSGNVIVQDFYTPKADVALVQFGVCFAGEFDIDPLFDAQAFETTGIEECGLTLEEITHTYIEMLLKERECSEAS